MMAGSILMRREMEFLLRLKCELVAKVNYCDMRWQYIMLLLNLL